MGEAGSEFEDIASHEDGPIIELLSSDEEAVPGVRKP